MRLLSVCQMFGCRRQIFQAGDGRDVVLILQVVRA